MNERSDITVCSGSPKTRVVGCHRAWALLPLVAAVVLALAACAPTAAPGRASAADDTRDVQPTSPVEASTSTPSTPATPTPLASASRVGILGAPESLDPRSANGVPDTQVMFAIMEPLLTLTPEYELRPRLATSWAVAEDGRLIRLDLREGVRFHDGSAFTSEDVKLTLESALDGRNEGLVSYLDDVLELVETPDATTAIVRFKQPAAYALHDLALIPMMPAQAATDFGNHPIGTLPLRVPCDELVNFGGCPVVLKAEGVVRRRRSEASRRVPRRASAAP